MKKIMPFLCIPLILFIYACQNPESDATSKSVSATKKSPAEVVVAPVEEGLIYKTYTSVGTVTPKDSSRIFPKVAGRISSRLCRGRKCRFPRSVGRPIHVVPVEDRSAEISTVCHAGSRRPTLEHPDNIVRRQASHGLEIVSE